MKKLILVLTLLISNSVFAVLDQSSEAGAHDPAATMIQAGGSGCKVCDLNMTIQTPINGKTKAQMLADQKAAGVVQPPATINESGIDP